MTVADRSPSKEYVEDGVTTMFAVPFRFRQPQHLLATRIALDGSVVQLAYGTDYSASGGAADAGGTLTVVAPAPGGTRLRITRVTPRTQAMNYAVGDTFPAESHEDALDNQMLVAQEQDAALGDLDTRSLKVPVGESAAEIPAAADRAGKYQAYDAMGRPIAALGTGNDAALRAEMADEDLGAALLADKNPGVGAVKRSQHDINGDFLHVRTFGVVALDGVTDETAKFKNAIASAILQKKPLHFDGDIVVSQKLVPTALVTGLRLIGSGRRTARIINKVIGDTCLNIGNSNDTELTDFSIVGNTLTALAGNGHAIDMSDPDMNVDPHLPSFPTLTRLNITGHRGVGKAYGGADMPAAGIYMANALGAVVDHLYIGNNGYGAYCYKAQQPEFRACAWEGNRYGALINDQCEALHVIDPDIVGVNDIDTGGTIHVGSGGGATGGSNRVAGAIVDYFGKGSVYFGGKLKNHRYCGLSIFSPYKPLLFGMYIRQDDAYAGVCGVYSEVGVRVINCEITYAGSAVAVARTGIKLNLTSGYQDFGEVSGNSFSLEGNGAFGTLIDLIVGVGSQRMVGRCVGNVAGNAGGASGASTVADFIKVTGGVRKLELRGNQITAGVNVTVTTAYNYAGITASSDEGLIDDGNSTWATGGGVVTNIRTGATARTGLQSNGKFEVQAVQVAGQQVVGARQAAVANAAGGATIDAEARTAINALLAAARAHGLIAP